MASKTDATPTEESSASLTSLTLIQFILWVTFLGFVSAGWYRIALGNWPMNVAAAFGALVSIAGLVCVWFIGRNYAAVLQHPEMRVVITLLGAVLLCISALGTITTFLYLSEGGAIYAETLDRANARLLQLRTAADNVLVTPNYDKLKSKTLDAWATARGELTTAQRCGEGEDFKRLFAAVEQALGAARGGLLLSGPRLYRGEQCKSEVVKQEIAQREKEYRNLIDDKLAQSSDYRSDKVAERIQLKTILQSDIDKAVDSLNRMQKQLRTSDLENREQATNELEKANVVFVKYRTALAAVDAVQMQSVPQHLDVKIITQLGSPTQVFRIFVSRWSEVWGYALAAVVFDFFLVYVAILRRKLWMRQEQLEAAAAAAAAERAAARVQPTAIQAPAPVPPKQNNFTVKHLWVAPSNQAVTSTSTGSPS